MFTRHERITRVAATAIGVLLAATLLVGCAAAGGGPAATDPAAPPAPTSAVPAASEPGATAPASPAPTVTGPAATPSASATEPAPAPAPAREFITQNGTMRLQLPAGWQITDESEVLLNHDNQQQWNNMVRFTSPEGTVLRYYDGYGSDVGAQWDDFEVVEQWDDFEVVEQREAVGGFSAIAYWAQAETSVVAGVVLGTIRSGGAPLAWVAHDGIARIHTMGLVTAEGTSGASSFASLEEAQAFLSSAAAEEALGVISTVELLPVPQYAMP